MKTGIFTVYDSKVEAYLPPFYMPTRNAALRAVTDILSEPDHSFTKHPEDYTLFFLGVFDDQNSKFEIEKTPQSLGVLIELIKPINPELKEVK